mgnify:FL=1
MTDKPDTTPEAEPSDVLLPGPPTEDGEGQHVLRSRVNDEGQRTLEVGIATPLREGEPIFSEIVETSPIPDSNLKKCKTIIKSPFPAPGPAKVNSEQFRAGWERIFGAGNEDETVN